jgi:hypothetical protein
LKEIENRKAETLKKKEEDEQKKKLEEETKSKEEESISKLEIKEQGKSDGNNENNDQTKSS